MTHPIDTTPEAIAALLDGVTPGPWTAHRDPCHFDTLSDVRGGAKRDVQGISSQIMVSVGGFADWKEQEANARFIAAARDLVPALAAEIARLTAERDEALVRAERSERAERAAHDAANTAIRQRDEARAQVAMAFEKAAKFVKSHDQSGVDCNWQGMADTIRALTPADATAALARRDAAMRNEGRKSVKVKPLVWELFFDQSGKRREFARNGHGDSYHVSDEGWWFPLRQLHACNGIVAAKSAAQADYEARILAALEPEDVE